MSRTYNLSEQNSVVHDYMERLRNVRKQKDRSSFRKNIERIGSFIGFEVSKTLNYREIEFNTPLAAHRHW